MNATIRQYIKRRVWWCVAIGIGGWLMFPLSGSIAKDLPAAVPVAMMIAGAVMFGGAMIALQWIVRCPRCKAKLARTIAMPVAFSWGSGPKINFCPYCGVNLDERLPHTDPVAASLNPIK